MCIRDRGRIIADNICGGDSRYLGSQGSSVIKVFDMTAATTCLLYTSMISGNKRTRKQVKNSKSGAFIPNSNIYYSSAFVFSTCFLVLLLPEIIL